METTQRVRKGQAILFFVSQCVTLFGSTLVQMAIVWYVTIATASGAWVAAFTICSYLPQFLISFIGGVWADRYDKKRLIILADAGIAVVTLVLMLGMPYLTDEPVMLGAFLFVSALRSFGAGVQMPAVNAVLPLLVPEAELMRYNGINATMQSVVQFAAPAAAGLILSVSTLQNALLLDILTAALGIGLLSAVAIPKRAETPQADSSALREMQAGVRYALSDARIGWLLLVYGLFIFLSVPAGFLAQLLVRRVYGDTYWYLSAVELVGFAGMAAGGAIMGVWGGFKSRVKTLLVGLILFGALAIGMGLAANFIIYLALMLLYGVALTMVQSAATTRIQEKAEANMQGRVFGLMGSMYAGFLPLGMALFGPLSDAVSLQYIMVGSGVALIAVALIMRANRGFAAE